MNWLAAFEVEDFNRLVVFRGQEETVTFQVRRKMVKVTGEARQRRRLNELERRLLLSGLFARPQTN